MAIEKMPCEIEIVSRQDGLDIDGYTAKRAICKTHGWQSQIVRLPGSAQAAADIHRSIHEDWR